MQASSHATLTALHDRWAMALRPADETCHPGVRAWYRIGTVKRAVHWELIDTRGILELPYLLSVLAQGSVCRARRSTFINTGQA